MAYCTTERRLPLGSYTGVALLHRLVREGSWCNCGGNRALVGAGLYIDRPGNGGMCQFCVSRNSAAVSLNIVDTFECRLSGTSTSKMRIAMHRSTIGFRVRTMRGVHGNGEFGIETHSHREKRDRKINLNRPYHGPHTWPALKIPWWQTKKKKKKKSLQACHLERVRHNDYK